MTIKRMDMQEYIVFFSELVKLQISLKECLFMCVLFGVSFLAELFKAETPGCVCVWCTQCSLLPERGKVLR